MSAMCFISSGLSYATCEHMSILNDCILSLSQEPAYRKAGTGRPCAVSGGGDDGGLVEVAGANKAGPVVRS